MAREDLFLASLAGELRTPEFSLAFLVDDESFERGECDEPKAVDEAAFNEVGAGEARNVVRCELDNARGVTRAQICGAVDYQFAGHEQTTWLQDLQSVRCLTL